MVDKKYTYWMPTNGQKPVKIKDITENMLEMLQGRGLGVTVSIDGNPEIHDKPGESKEATRIRWSHWVCLVNSKKNTQNYNSQ